MRILIRLLVLSLVAMTVIPLSGAVAPSSLAKLSPDMARSQLAAYFRGIERNSPTVLGGLAKSPESMAAIQERIAKLDDAELARISALMAQTPDWKVAPEAFASIFPPEVLQQVRQSGSAFAEQVPRGEIMRDDVRTLARVLVLLPDAKLAELGVTRKQVVSLDETFAGMTPSQTAMLRGRIDEAASWRERSAAAMQTLPPALQRGASALAEHGALTPKDIKELDEFRISLVQVLTRIENLPPVARKKLKAVEGDGLRAQIDQLSKAPPDVLFMVRHNMPPEMLRTLEANLGLLERVANISAEEAKALEDFRTDLARAFRQVRGEGQEEWAAADEMLAGLGPEHLLLLRDRMAPLGGWRAGLPAVYQTLAASDTPANLRAVQGAQADPEALRTAETFRTDSLAWIDAAAATPSVDRKLVARAREVLAGAPIDRVELMRLASERLPATASIADRLSIVALHDINFNCSLSMTAVPRVCWPEICWGALGCTPGYCTDAVTVTASFDVICNPIEDALEAVEHSVTSTANSAVETMRAGIQATISGVQSTINASVASVTNIVNTSVSAITDTVNSIYAFVQTIPGLAWQAIQAALNLLLDLEIKNGVTVRDLVNRGTEHALTSMTTLLGLSGDWWKAISSFTLPAIPCPPSGFHTPFGNVGDGAAAANYGRYRLMIDGIIGMIPDTETSLAIKIPAQLTYMLFDFLGTCLEQAAADADSAEGTARHTLVMANFGTMRTLVTAQIDGLTASSGQQTSTMLNLLTSQNQTAAATATAQGQTIRTLVGEQAASTQALVNTESDAVQALLRREVDDRQKQISDFRALQLRMTIESVLQAGIGADIASLQLAAPWGSLDTVRAVVRDTINAMTAAGENVGQAPSYYDAAVQLMNAGKYKPALREFMKAYRDVAR